jgi:hypothetical protein
MGRCRAARLARLVDRVTIIVAPVVRLCEGDLLLARAWESQIKATGLDDRPCYSGQARDDRYFIGYLGELAVARMLHSFGVHYSHRVHVTGKSAPTELCVRALDGGKATIEVKTCGQPYHTELLFIDKLHDRSATWVVAARIERLGTWDADVAIIGWITGATVDSLPLKNGNHGIAPSRFLPFERMNRMHELIDMLAPVRRVERAA